MSTTTYHLRPVSDVSPSPSPTASTTPPGDHSPHYKQPHASGRRPLSPSHLRGILTIYLSFIYIQKTNILSDIDLSHTHDMTTRTGNYPTPPSGHDLMAMFPAKAPENFEMRPGPTSDFFKRQERAFFAQAGKEIVRVRVEVDFPHGSELDVKQQRPASRPWPLNGPGPGPGPSSSAAPPHHSPGQSPSAPILYPHPATRPPRVSGPNPSPMFPHTPTSNQLPSNLHPPVHQTTSGLRTPPEDSTTPSSKPEYSEEYEADESWRRPMPYAERRRAGKHTRRIIVRT